MGRVNAEVQLNLPPGFRFFPTDEELLVHYLCRKAASQTLAVPIIAEVDLYKFDPWQLPDKALFGEKEWYFFTPRDRKYPNGSRPNRAAGSGYWKATGADKPITAKNSGKRVGIKKALVFYVGKAPKGTKTNWIMHEYRLADANRTSPAKKKGSLRLDDWVLCRIYNKKSSAEKLAKEHKEWSQDETMEQVHPHDEMDERETREIHHGGAASGHGLIEHSERTCQDSDKSSLSPDCTTASVHDSRISAVASMSCNPAPFFQHRMNPSNGSYPQIELTALAPLFSSMNNTTTTTTTATTRAAYDAGEPAPPLLMTDSSCSMQSSPDIKSEKEEVQSRPKMSEFILAQLQQQDNVTLNQPFYNFGFESLPNPFSQLDHMQAHSANPTDPLQDYFTSLSAPGLQRTY